MVPRLGELFECFIDKREEEKERTVVSIISLFMRDLLSKVEY
jgi:hypothetical protein